VPDTKQAVSQGRSARALEFHRTIASAADADDGGVAAVQAVRTMLAAGDVDYTLPMPSQALSSDGTTHPIRPLHRAVQTGSLVMVNLFVDDEIHPKALSAVLNMRTEFGFTVLHWACLYNYAPIVELLLDRPLEQQCDTSATNYRGKTAWDVAEAVKAQAVLKVLETFADPSHRRANPGLCKEKERRQRRPEVEETFRDDMEIEYRRFILWVVENISEAYGEPIAEGGYGRIFLLPNVSPPLQVGKRLFHRVVLKVPKPIGVQELKDEVVALSHLCHDNVVQILGMTEGPAPGTGGDNAWQMALEFCETDMLKIVHGKVDTDLEGKAYQEYSGAEWAALMATFAEQIAAGCVYIHSQERPHLDIKPENILIAHEASGYVCKLADFGMAFSEPVEEAAAAAAIDEEAIVPYGTWEYLSPECWKRKYGNPSFASDMFAFGLMLWEMVSRSRIYRAFPGFENDDEAPVTDCSAAGSRPTARRDC
jgi:hypothetical protein